MSLSRSPLVAAAPIRRWAVAVCACGLLAIGLLAIGLGADQPSPKDKPAGESPKLSLFDGQSLDGWKKTPFGGEGEVKVEDGAIVMSFGGSMTGITSTRQDLPTLNYELTYEAKRVNGFDFFAAATFPVGKTHVTLVNGGWGGSVTGISSIDGSDASENETGKYFEYKNDKWYKFRVQVTKGRLQAWIDDKPAIDVDIRDRKLGTRLETDSCKPLGFATWETAGAVRKIEMRKLTPAEIVAASKPSE